MALAGKVAMLPRLIVEARHFAQMAFADRVALASVKLAVQMVVSGART